MAGKGAGSVMTVSFELDGQQFIALNGGPHFKFTEAIPFTIDCKDQAEVDYYWDTLSAGGQQQPCGWLKDRFGLSWQVVPSALDEMMSDPDPVRSSRVMQAMLQMKKMDLGALRRAYESRT